MSTSGPAGIGQRIKELREAKGWKVAELGHLMKHRDGANVSRWENGLVYPSYWQLVELCHIFNVSLTLLCDYHPQVKEQQNGKQNQAVGAERSGTVRYSGGAKPPSFPGDE